MIKVRIVPEEGGKILLDGRTYDPRIAYQEGEVVEIKVLPLGDYQFTGWSGDIQPGYESQVPLRMKVLASAQEVVAHFACGVRHAADLSFDSSFENGNGIPRYIYRGARTVVVEPEQIKGADNIWWHFKISGITPGEFLQIWPLHSPLGDEANTAWAGDCHPVYSYDGVTWHRFTGMRVPYVQQFTESTVAIARNTPYTYSRTVQLTQEISSPHVTALDLATSEEGRPVKTIRITDPSVPDSEKAVIWIMARQHAFESHSSWYAEGIIKWLADSHPLAADLRKRSLTYITPIMDVDNVYNGGSGKEQYGPDGKRADFNRRWDDSSPWAAIRGAKDLLLGLKQQHDIAAFIDLHNPWYPRPGHWAISHEFAADVVPFAETWTQSLEETGTRVRFRHDLRVRGRTAGVEGTIHDDREPTTDTLTSGAWARQALVDAPEGHLYFTNEIPHWQDGYGNFVGIRELYAYGEAMGRALAKWASKRSCH